MIKDITIGQYYPGNSVIHKADPRVKIILTFIFMIVIFILNNYMSFSMMTLFTILVIIASDVPIKYTLKGLKPIMIIVIFAALINIFTTTGTPIFEYGIIHITNEGIKLAAKMAMRLILLVTFASLLTLTTTPILLTDGIEKLMEPMKRIGIPAHEIAMMMTIALRFIPTLLEETDKIMKAQAARGAEFDTGNIVQRAKSFIPVLVPLFISAFRRADELAMAMEARCYRGSEGRTRMKQLKLSWVDLEISFTSVLFIGGLLYLQYL